MLTTAKQCAQCTLLKELSQFHKDKAIKDGRRSRCKECLLTNIKDYQRTKDGLIAKIYSAQRSNSKTKGNPTPTYSKQELKDWLYSQKKFHLLYDNWKRLNFQKDYIPSVDRKDDYLEYSIQNIQLMTWSENNAKGHKSRVDGTNNKQNEAVYQYTKEGEFVAEYHSQREASRVAGVSQGNICMCCLGNRKSAGGFVWRYCK